MIRRQRELAELPMRRFAAMVGISNPYLSQIERGLRAPSERVLHAIAQSLRTSAETLLDLAADRTAEPETVPPVLTAIGADPNLTARQRQALVEVYSAMTDGMIARRSRGRTTAGPR